MRRWMLVCTLCACIAPISQQLSHPAGRGPGAAGGAGAGQAELDQVVQQLMREHHRIGVAAAVTENGKVVWHQNYGVASRETGTPVTDSTIFSVCSLSKPVLLVAVLKTLEEMSAEGRGKPAELLDRDLRELAPSLSDLQVRNPRFPDTAISLRMLLSHVSSILDDYSDIPHHTEVEGPGFRYVGLELEEALTRYLSPLPALAGHFSQAEPGTEAHYSGPGSALAALFVAAHAGKRYEEYVQEKIFDPLGMRSSAFRMAALIGRYPDLKQYATPYHFDEVVGENVALVPPYTEHTFFPAGSLRTTILDYAAFVAALAGTKEGSGLVSAGLFAEAQRIQYPNIDPDRALIFARGRRDEVDVMGHRGRNPGLTSSMFFTQPGAAGQVYGVVILTNGDEDLGATTFEGRLGTELLRRARTGTLHSARVVYDQLGFSPGTRPQVIVLGERALEDEQIEVSERGRLVPFKMVSRKLDQDTNAWVHVLSTEIPSGNAVEVRVLGGLPHSLAVVSEPTRALERALLRSYYLQRCGVDVVDSATHAGRSACHLADGERARSDSAGHEGAKVQATGGWHDAGDYGKYVATTATVILEVLTRYERFPGLLADDDLDIPESGNGTPDVLDEMAIGLDWMLEMQRQDGAVYRKLSGASWPLKVAPSDDTQTRYLYGPSSADSAKAAAAWALAARVYRRADRTRAQAYLAAARRTWGYVDGLTVPLIDAGPQDNSGSGPYMLGAIDQEASLRTDNDDKLAAAIELYLTTGEKSFATAVDALLPSHTLTPFEWKNVAGLSISSLCFHPHSRPQWRAIARAKLEELAAQGLVRARENAFGVAIENFVWGSNKLVAQQGVVMLAQARARRSTELEDTARGQLHYLLGANPLGKCFVTGFGSNPVQRVSHLFVRATGRSFPGLFVGGPNEHPLTEFVEGGRGMLSYVDDDRSYDTNEYAIDYNSALLALLIDLRAMEHSAYAELVPRKGGEPAGLRR